MFKFCLVVGYVILPPHQHHDHNRNGKSLLRFKMLNISQIKNQSEGKNFHFSFAISIKESSVTINIMTETQRKQASIFEWLFVRSNS